MSEAMKLIVDGYVKLRDDLKAHRCRLATELKSLNGPFDLTSSVKQIEREIEVVEEGLAKLAGER